MDNLEQWNYGKIVPRSFAALYSKQNSHDIIVSGTVEPPIMDPPRSGQPLYSGQTLCYRLRLL